MTSNVTPVTERYAVVGKTAVLRKDIAAIQAVTDGRGRPELGVVLQLPEGLQVEVCGGGFSSQTVKVRTKGDFFFVLRRNVIGEVGAQELVQREVGAAVRKALCGRCAEK